jgi:hypothetical protein
MSDGSDGKKCDGVGACVYMDPATVACGSCNGESACSFLVVSQANRMYSAVTFELL